MPCADKVATLPRSPTREFALPGAGKALKVTVEVIPNAPRGSRHRHAVHRNKRGIVISTNVGCASVPIRAELRCVDTQVRRWIPLNSGGNLTPKSCSGGYAIDMNAFTPRRFGRRSRGCRRRARHAGRLTLLGVRQRSELPGQFVALRRPGVHGPSMICRGSSAHSCAPWRGPAGGN